MAQYTLELENAIVSDDFVLAGKILDKIHEKGDDILYINQVVELLHIVPAVNYGMSGPVVNFIEKQDYTTYLDTLLRVAADHPSEHSVWCIKRIIRKTNEDIQHKCLAVLREIVTHEDISPAVFDLAKECIVCYDTEIKTHMEIAIDIRRVTKDDYERFSQIIDQVQMLHVKWRPDVYKEVSSLISVETFAEILQGDSWYVAEVDGEVAGILELVERHIEGPSHVTKNILYVSTMAVEEKFRGRGIGHAFFDLIRKLKEEKGFDTIELQVNSKNVQAYEMYRKYGFTEKSINMELLQ